MPNGAQTSKPLLRASELSVATGLTPAQIYRWTSEGRFPAEFLFRVGRKVFFKRALIGWLSGNGAEPPPVTG